MGSTRKVARGGRGKRKSAKSVGGSVGSSQKVNCEVCHRPPLELRNESIDSSNRLSGWSRLPDALHTVASTHVQVASFLQRNCVDTIGSVDEVVARLYLDPLRPQHSSPLAQKLPVIRLLSHLWRLGFGLFLDSTAGLISDVRR
uniref:Uncharacterized protein n=1 Tax=Mycena chlorophos TaxID=658473 RepID=A0ABQ0LRE1_MYCCL|nr:predicted protein [Mycena chlorophos]